MSKKKTEDVSDGSTPEVPPTRVYGTGLGSGKEHSSYTESHPSYGMIRIGRTHGGAQRMFGSPIECPTTIRIEICEAVVNHDLSRDWYHARKQLIEVRMSPAQWAELITNMNVGDGVPCTLERVAGVQKPDCPQRHDREEITDDFAKSMKKLAERVAQMTEAALAIVNNKDKKTLTNADRDAIRGTLHQVGRFLTDSAPFIHSQFDEAMDKTVNAAKAEFSAAAMTIAHSLGIEEMAARLAAGSLNSGPLSLPAAGGGAPTGDDGDERG